MKTNYVLPEVTFYPKEKDPSDNTIKIVEKTTADYFANKRVILFSIPAPFDDGPGNQKALKYEKIYAQLLDLGIEEVYCISTLDTHTMKLYKEHYRLSNLKMIPDGNATFTNAIGMLVTRKNLGLGSCSWSYAAVVDNGVVEKDFVEPDLCQEASGDVNLNHVSFAGEILDYCRIKQGLPPIER
tara:strand:- start:785 stop:1336 length:552 start_codon:yes stop_codon:yes gene_type:complete